MALGLIPRGKKTTRRGEGTCTIERGKNKGKVVSCAKWGGTWRKRKPVCKSKTDTNCRRPRKVKAGCKVQCGYATRNSTRKSCVKRCTTRGGKVTVTRSTGCKTLC